MEMNTQGIETEQNVQKKDSNTQIWELVYKKDSGEKMNFSMALCWDTCVANWNQNQISQHTLG